MRDGAGQIVRWVGTNTDVDDQKNSEALLEARLAERTAALAQTSERLQQSQKMEAIGNLTGGVAHDFNNLLSAVLGSLELLRKRLPNDPNLIRLVDNAMEGANRGAVLTRRMLAFARRQDLRSERIDLRGLVSGMRELLERALGPTVAIDVTLPDDIPAVETDPNQLETALLNLAVNARDAMHGEGTITISAREENLRTPANGLSAGHYVRLSVTDTGEGMDAETLRRAAEPFFTTKGVGKGTGLGLSMVHGLATQSGGTLVLRSRRGEGTTAEIWLPAVTGAAAEAVAQPAPQTTIERLIGERRLRVLAVDDDALVLMNTTAMLEDMGHSVTEARSGREALDRLLDSDGFDLVITDHAMPQMTGAQLAREIRARWAHLPILLATGYAELPSGTDLGLPRLSKPFNQADLERALATVMPAPSQGA
jgi:signal transduction histidine kinase/ActR/RegA family two-component response regulator